MEKEEHMTVIRWVGRIIMALLFERYEKRKQERVICSHCKETIPGDIIVIDGKKFNREKLQTR